MWIRCALIVFIVTLSPLSVAQQPNAELVKSVVGGNAPPRSHASDDLHELYNKRLSEERQILERQSERQFLAVDKLIDRAIWLMTGLLGAIALAFYLLFGQSRRELKASFKEMFEAQAKQVIDTQATQLQARYRELQRNVDALLAYKDRQIVWVTPHGVEPTQDVVTAFNAAGFRNLSLLSPDTGESFEIGEPDLVVMTHDASPEARRILETLSRGLKERSPPVPLLIYCFREGGEPTKLEAADFTALQGFSWFVPVNFPAQLLAQVQQLARQDRATLGGSGE